MKILAAVSCVLLVAAACGDGDDDTATQGSTQPSVRTSTSTAAPRTSTTAPAQSTTTVPEVFPTDALPCQPIPTPQTPVTGIAQVGDVYLTNVAESGDDCVDHVVFEFTSKDAKPPGYNVTYGSPPFEAPGSGDAVAVAGSAWVLVKVAPGYGFDFETGTATYTGPKRIAPTGANHVREIVQIGDFEGELTWAIGLDSKRPFSVQATASPRTQLAVTIG
jgi:hypothetical protein